MNTDSEQKSLDGTGASIGQDMGGHPLFNRPETETGPDPRRFDLIRIYRFLPDGSMETCPRLWKGSELRSVEQIIDMYGGGKYRCQAICGTTHRIQAYSEYFYCAEPARKPFHGDANRLPDAAQASPPPAPPPPPPPPPPAPAVDLTALIKFLLEKEARTAEAQAKTQETLLRIALERPAPPNVFEGVRDVVQLMQTMNHQQPAGNNGSDPVKMLERGIAMGKDLASGDGGAGEDKIPWGGLVEAATVGLSLLKKKNEKEDAKPAKSEERPKAEQAKSETPAPQPAPLPQIMFDPATGMPYTFIAGLGFVRLDPAVVFAQMYGHRPPPAPPQYPYAHPFGMPNALPPAAPPQAQAMPMAYPYASMSGPPAPPAPMPQAAPIPAPPQTMPIAQPAGPLPRPVAPPAPPPSPAPATVRSARLQGEAVPAQPAKTPSTPRKPEKTAIPKLPPRQTASIGPTIPPTTQASGVPPPSSKSNTTAVDELWDGLPAIGDDFAQIVNDGMNSPMAQQIMQDPRYLTLRDAVVNGEMSVGDVNEEFVHVLFGSNGGGP